MIARPVPFPLHPIIDGACGCGAPGCSRAGKHPAVLWRELAFGDPVPRPVDGAGVGLKTGAEPRGSGIIVIDLDGEEAIEAWAGLGGATETFTVATGRDFGVQLYFEHPGFPVRNSVGELGPGVDVRGEGGFVVAAGSPHRSGRRYEVLVEAPLAPVPEWLAFWLRVQGAPAEAQTYDGDVDGEERERRIKLFRDYLSTAPPCVAGSGGDVRLFDVVQRGAYDLALPVDDVLEAVRDVYDPRCVPPWGEELDERVRHKAHCAKTQSTRPALPPLPADLAHLAAAPVSPFADIPVRAESVTPLEGPDVSKNFGQTEHEKALGLVWGGWDEPLTPPDYVVDKLVPAATVGMFIAKGSSLKTWAALSIGTDVAEGLPWLGAYETKKGPVVLVDYESGRWQIASRMEILGRRNSRDFAHANFPGLTIEDAEFWRHLAHVVVTRGVRLVIVDSFAAGASGLDENSASEIKIPLQHAGLFSERFGCAVLFIHHAKKGDGGDERDVARGSSAIYAGCDWVYNFDPLNEERTKMRITCAKPWGPKPPDVCVELSPVDGLRLAVDEDRELAGRVEEKILAALAKGPAANLAALNRAMGVKSGTVTAGDVDALVVRRRVAKLPGLGYVLDDPKARRERILGAARVPGKTSVAALAKAASVDEAEVDALLVAGDLFRSSAGFTPSA